MIKCFEDRNKMKSRIKRTQRLFIVGMVLLLFLAKGVLAFSSPPNTAEVPRQAETFYAPALTDADWPMFHKDAGRSGSSNDMSLRPPLSIKWIFSTGGNNWASPAVVNSICYVGSSDGKLYAINIKTGESIWEFKTGDAIYSSPAVDGGMVYVGSLDRRLYAVDARSGELQWVVETGDPITSSPCVIDGFVYVGSWDGNLYAIDSKTGAIKWKFQTDGPIYSSPAAYQNYVYIGSSDGSLYALDRGKGTVAWAFKTGDYVSSSPCVADKIVYIGSWDNHLYALNCQTGNLIWKYKADDGIYATPAVSGDIIVFGSYDGKLYALSKDRGYVKWVYKAQKSSYHSSPIIVNNIIYIGLSYQNKVQAFELKTGEYIWNYLTGASVGATPAVSNYMMFLASSDGKVYAFGDIQPPVAKAKVDQDYYGRTRFIVSWSGVDEGGSLIKNFDVQFKQGAGEEWISWMTSVTTTSAVFGPESPVTVKDGRTYYFQARARDNAGNIGTYAGEEGDAHVTIDMSPPSIGRVEIDKIIAKPGSFISPTPLIKAKIIDNVGVDPNSIDVVIDGVTYKPDSFNKGNMEYRHKKSLLPGYHNIKIFVSDVSGNKSRIWEIDRVRVSVGIATENLKVAPNPFNPLAGPTFISYNLNADTNMTFYIYDKFGSLIYSSRFLEGAQGGKKGYNKLEWRGVSSSRVFVQNGDYTFKLIANRDLVGKSVITVQK